MLLLYSLGDLKKKEIKETKKKTFVLRKSDSLHDLRKADFDQDDILPNDLNHLLLDTLKDVPKNIFFENLLN